ncbi:Hypothetical_protein [Hexamita inflata]|uniref:Hypothetical_protein n=1 Tax=Hexamita inflata TaxID=28002 RepID=A0AA86RBW5_9EUKA|nr:Hypothetical protein HINF_LOCUS57698 [Hexamita inflata]
MPLDIYTQNTESLYTSIYNTLKHKLHDTHYLNGCINGIIAAVLKTLNLICVSCCTKSINNIESMIYLYLPFLDQAHICLRQEFQIVFNQTKYWSVTHYGNMKQLAVMYVILNYSLQYKI